MPQRHDCYVNNKWESSYGPAFISRNPATQEAIWQGHTATEHEVSASISAARQAYQEWYELSLDERITYLEKFQTILLKNTDSLASIISKEMGKPLWESKTEINSMINKVTVSIEAYQNRCAEMVRNVPGGLSVTRHKPHGCVVVLGPFNFPGHLPNGHIIPALLAGNTVVFKPSELTPLFGEEMTKCWSEVGLPPGVFNMVQGSRDTGRLLSGHPQIDGLYFTGSYETGLILSEIFAKHPGKILALEMGGNNPLVVSQIDDLKAAALATVQSAFLTSGQRCSCARRLIVLRNETGDQFLNQLMKLMDTIKVGPYTDTPEPYMGPVISESTMRFLLTVQKTFKDRGGIPLREMKQLRPNSALLSPGLMDVTAVSQRPDEEIFGPFLQVIRVPNFEAAIQEANRTAYGLTAGLLSKSEEEYRYFYNNIRAGVINWNTPLTGASSAASFGGIGRSGNNRPSAYYAADYCSYPVASLETTDIAVPSTLPPGLSL